MINSHSIIHKDAALELDTVPMILIPTFAERMLHNFERKRNIDNYQM
jgi:hypothetical protein